MEVPEDPAAAADPLQVKELNDNGVWKYPEDPAAAADPAGRTLVVGRGATTIGAASPTWDNQTMDSPSRNPTHPMLLEDALKKNPSLKGQFIDASVERIGVNPSPPPGLTTGLTPAASHRRATS